MIIPFAEVYLHESIIQHIQKSTLIVIALMAHPSYLIHYRRHPISCPSTCTHIIHPTWHTYDPFIIHKEQTDIPLPLPLHQSSKPFILLHLCRLLRGKESDKLSQFFAGGVIELA